MERDQGETTHTESLLAAIEGAMIDLGASPTTCELPDDTLDQTPGGPCQESQQCGNDVDPAMEPAVKIAMDEERESPWVPVHPYVGIVWRTERRHPGLIVAIERAVRTFLERRDEANRPGYVRFPACPDEDSTSSASRSSSPSGSCASSSSRESVETTIGPLATHSGSRSSPRATPEDYLEMEIGEEELPTDFMEEQPTEVTAAPVEEKMLTDNGVPAIPPTPPSTPTPPVVLAHRPENDRPGPNECWDCGQPGHSRKKCPNPTGDRICYGCGRHHVTLRTCSSCAVEWMRRGPYVPSLGRNLPRDQIPIALQQQQLRDTRRDSYPIGTYVPPPPPHQVGYPSRTVHAGRYVPYGENQSSRPYGSGSRPASRNRPDRDYTDEEYGRYADHSS